MRKRPRRCTSQGERPLKGSIPLFDTRYVMAAYKFSAEAPSSEVQNHRSRRRDVRLPAVLSPLQMLQETGLVPKAPQRPRVDG